MLIGAVCSCVCRLYCQCRCELLGAVGNLGSPCSFRCLDGRAQLTCRCVRSLWRLQFLACVVRLSLLLLKSKAVFPDRYRVKALMQTFSGVLNRPSVERIMKVRMNVCGRKDGLIKAAAAFHEK